MNESIQKAFHFEGKTSSEAHAGTPKRAGFLLLQFRRWQSPRRRRSSSDSPSLLGKARALIAKFFRRKTTAWGILSGILGVSLAVLAIHLAVHEQRQDLTFLRFMADFAMFLAMTFFSVGLVSIILDMKSWKEYFEEGLRNIVLHREFLKKLSHEQLLAYQVDIFKRSYNKDDIDQEGRFLRYCLDHIHDYIVKPYREEVRNRLTIEDSSPERPGCLRVSETMRYVCRAGRGGIQEGVFWETNEETLEVESFSLELYPPDGQGKPESVPSKKNKLKNRKLPDGTIRYEFGLGRQRKMDGLEVVIHVTYLVDQSKFCTWRMMFPSRNVDILISYPKDFKVQFIPFLLDPEPDYKKTTPGEFSITFKSWIMPMSGFAWKLLAPREIGKLPQEGTESSRPGPGREPAAVPQSA